MSKTTTTKTTTTKTTTTPNCKDSPRTPKGCNGCPLAKFCKQNPNRKGS